MLTPFKSLIVFASITPLLVFGFAESAHAGSDQASGAYSPDRSRAQAVRGAAYSTADGYDQTRYSQPNDRARVTHRPRAQWLRPWPGDTRRVKPRVPVYAGTTKRYYRRADRPRASKHRARRYEPLGYGDKHYRHLYRRDRRRYRRHTRTGVVLRSSGRHRDASWRYGLGHRYKRRHHNRHSGATIELRF